GRGTGRAHGFPPVPAGNEQRAVRLLLRRVDLADLAAVAVHLADTALEADGVVAVPRVSDLVLPALKVVRGALHQLPAQLVGELADPRRLQDRWHAYDAFSSSG